MDHMHEESTAAAPRSLDDLRAERLGGVRADAPAGDKAVAGIMLAIVFLLPLFFFPTQSLSLEFSKYVFVAGGALLGFLVWLALRLKDGDFSLPKSGLLAAGFAIVLAYFVSAVRAPGFWNSFSGVIYDRDTVISMIVLFLLMLLTAIVVRTRARAFSLYGALAISALLTFVFEAIHFFLPNTFTLGSFAGVASNMIGKWNDIGVLFGLIGLLSLITVELMPARSLVRTGAHALLAASVLVLLIVNFDLLWILLALFSLGFLLWNRMAMAKASLPTATVVVFVISAVFALSGSFASLFPTAAANYPWLNIGGAIVDKLGVSQIEVRPSWQSTLGVIKGTLMQSPIFGAGPARFSNQWGLYKSPDINSTIFWDTDFQSGIGLIPSFVVTTGMLGALAWIVFFAIFLVGGVHALFRKSADLQERYFIVSSFAAALYLWLVAIFYVPSTVTFALAFIMTGAWIGILSIEHIGPLARFNAFATQRRGFLAALVLIICILASAVGIYSLVRKTDSVMAFNASQTAFAAGDITGSQADMASAARLNPQDVYYRSLAQIDMTEIQNLLATTSKDVSQDQVRAQFQTLFADAVDNAQKAVAANTTDAANYFTLGDIYASVVPLGVQGGYDNAAKSYAKAVEVDPTSPLGPLEQARLEVANNNINGARSYIDKALALKPNYTDARYLLAQIEASQGNTQKAVDAVAAAAQLDPNNIGLLFQLGLLYYNQKDYKDVVPVLERAVTLSPQYSNAIYFLGLSYWQLGRHQDAITAFNVIAQLNPDNTEVTQILANMNAGREPFASFNPPATPPEKRATPPVNDSASKTAKAAKAAEGSDTSSNL